MIAARALAAARAIRIEDELSRRGIKLRGRVDRCGACPRCGGDDRFSTQVRDQVFNCRGCGGKGRGVIDLVMFLDGCDFKTAVENLAGASLERTVCSIAKQHTLAVKKCEDRPQNGASLWQASADPRGTLVEQYLKSRALELPDEAANEAIRFHPSCPMGIERYPAMVCLVRHIVTNAQQAIHRTALMPDGTAVKRNGKTFRMSLGPITGGAVKLDPDEDVTQGLCVGEGVETCLAGRQMGVRPVWALLCAAGIATFPVLPGIEGLHIFREKDANFASPKAIEACAARWHASSAVIVVDPEGGSDLNDEMCGAAV